jgi:threonine dehydrogenase-like Zn-dependent dehydrogenase
VLGLGPIGDMSCRVARHRGAGTVIGLDLVDERLARARARGVEVIDLRSDVDPVEAVRDLTDGRGPDAVIDAVGMEAHGAPIAAAAQLTLFDKQIQLRMGQANVKRWTDDIMPLLADETDPLGVDDFATHRVSLDQAPDAYDMFQKKRDGAVKVLLRP